MKQKIFSLKAGEAHFGQIFRDNKVALVAPLLFSVCPTNQAFKPTESICLYSVLFTP